MAQVTEHLMARVIPGEPVHLFGVQRTVVVVAAELLEMVVLALAEAVVVEPVVIIVEIPLQAQQTQEAAEAGTGHSNLQELPVRQAVPAS